MRLTNPPYSKFKQMPFTDLKVLRPFYRWTAFTAKLSGRNVIILDEYERRRVTLCEYDDIAEFNRDVEFC